MSDVEGWLTEFYMPLLKRVMKDALRSLFVDWVADIFCQPPEIFIEKAEALLAEIDRGEL